MQLPDTKVTTRGFLEEIEVPGGHKVFFLIGTHLTGKYVFLNMSLHWTRLIDKNRQTDCLKLRKWTQQIKCNQLATPCTILHSCKKHISLLLSGFITQDQYDYAANVTFFGAFSGHLGQEDAVDWQNAAPLGMFEVSSNSGPTSYACILTKTL